MILRILLLVFNGVLGTDDTFAFPTSIEGYDQYENAKCITADQNEPAKLVTFFLSEGPTLCAYICSEQQGCSGFAFSHLEKDACELYVLEEYHDNVVAFVSNPDGFTWETTGDHVDPLSILPVTFGTVNDFANEGLTCTDFGTLPFCMPWQEWRCYIRITSQPSVSPSSSPSTCPSLSPSLSPSVLPSLSPSVVPTVGPSTDPSLSPTSDQPSLSPTSDSPSVQPTVGPSMKPSGSPSVTPTVMPTDFPSVSPTAMPSTSPSANPTTDSPSSAPTTESPSTSPSAPPTGHPSFEPTNPPTLEPTACPTYDPTVHPTFNPTDNPTFPPTTDSPSTSPSCSPSVSPSMQPTTDTPSTSPSTKPTSCPTSDSPSASPSSSPSVSPSSAPTTDTPTANPSTAPSTSPSVEPSFSPSVIPSEQPSQGPSVIPTQFPIGSPSAFPSAGPTACPTVRPSNPPSVVPTTGPSVSPETSIPSVIPTEPPSGAPSVIPSNSPSRSPVAHPSASPSVNPSFLPSSLPTTGPSIAPSEIPSISPSAMPTNAPSVQPTLMPTSSDPSIAPSVSPSVDPTRNPTTDQPSRMPSDAPTDMPTQNPSMNPTFEPSLNPTKEPTFAPSKEPSFMPTSEPSVNPTYAPTLEPTQEPTLHPTKEPTVPPTFEPTREPTHEPSKPPSVSPSRGPTAAPTVTPSDVPTIAPTETNPCSGPSDFIVGSKYVDLVLADSSFSDSDVLTITLQVPQKYRIQSISFRGGNPSSVYAGEDTDYWTMTTKTDLECLYYPQFVADWSDVQSNVLAEFTLVTEDGVQYLFNKMTLELEETVYSNNHNYEFNRTVLYEMPFAIELQSVIELEVDMSMVIPTVSPSVSPSHEPSVNPTTGPSTSPSGAPTVKAMDHLFTRFALYTPDVNGNSLVDINFTTIVRMPWTVQDGEFYIIDDENDAMVDDSQVFRLLEDCHSAFTYESFEGLCVDENYRYPPTVYADLANADPNLCKYICDQTDDCEAYDVSGTFEKCSIIGVNIDQSYTTTLQPYLAAGESWTYIGTTGGSPVQGRVVPGAANFCNIKEIAAWQTDLCASVDGVPPHPEVVPECYCYQDWNLQYISGDVCDVSGWWTLGMTIESGETQNNLYYETRVWVGLTSACAKVIGSSEVCYDEAPCSISGFDEAERVTPMSKFYVSEQAYFVVTVGGNAPIANVEVLDMSLQQQGRSQVTVPDTDYQTENLVSQQVAGTDNRFSASVDLTVDVNEPTFEGTIAGVASSLFVTIGITYEDGVTERRRLEVYSPEGDQPSVELALEILVYPKRCLNPEGNFGSHLVKTCPQGKTIRVCRENGWENLVAECPEDEATLSPDQETVETVISDTETDVVLTNTQQGGSQSTVIIENSSDNDTASLWKLLTVVAAGVVLLVVCLLWYCKQKEHEEVERKIVQGTMEVEDSEWDTTDYSVTDTSYYQDKANQELAMKVAYEEIFQQYTTYGEHYLPPTPGGISMDESDV